MAYIPTKQDIIRGAIADQCKRRLADIAPSSRLAEDLGLRSLGRIELAVLLEQRLGQPVRDDQVLASATVADLERTLGARPQAGD